MECVAGVTGTQFPCIDGFRHMHIATQYDMSVEVPPDDKDKTDILFALGVTDCKRLYNPQAFRSKSTHESQPCSSFPSQQAGGGSAARREGVQVSSLSLQRRNARVLPGNVDETDSNVYYVFSS
jgi:hypothetical protein